MATIFVFFSFKSIFLSKNLEEKLGTFSYKEIIIFNPKKERKQILSKPGV